MCLYGTLNMKQVFFSVLFATMTIVSIFILASDIVILYPIEKFPLKKKLTLINLAQETLWNLKKSPGKSSIIPIGRFTGLNVSPGSVFSLHGLLSS